MNGVRNSKALIICIIICLLLPAYNVAASPKQTDRAKQEFTNGNFINSTQTMLYRKIHVEDDKHIYYMDYLSDYV